jgi:hypothetical protein
MPLTYSRCSRSLDCRLWNPFQLLSSGARQWGLAPSPNLNLLSLWTGDRLGRRFDTISAMAGLKSPTFFLTKKSLLHPPNHRPRRASSTRPTESQIAQPENGIYLCLFGKTIARVIAKFTRSSDINGDFRFVGKAIRREGTLLGSPKQYLW